MKPSVHLMSLGCAKNLVDSEVMLGVLLQAGYVLENQPEHADVLIVNTCGFVEGSKQESIHTILEANQLKSIRPGQKLVVAGCLAQRYVKQLQEELPEVSAFIGINEVPKIHEILEKLNIQPGGRKKTDRLSRLQEDVQSPQNLVSRKPIYLYDFATPRYQITPAHYAYLKVGEGCNHPCAFCSIPIMRGRYRSRSIEDVEAEARALIGRGVRELLLISQDTTWYGRDLKIKNGLSDLLKRLNAIEGNFWIRVLYTHPAHWNDSLLEAMAECEKVCRYVDMPIQHIHDEMLMRMRRETSRAHIEEWIQKIRKNLPQVVFRTTLIVGFPGESEHHFESLMEFVKQTRFERLGVFAYSQEDGTVAGRMEQQLEKSLKEERRKKLMKIQQKISGEWTARQIGKLIKVLVEKTEKGFSGRTEWDAPEVDGKVILKGNSWQPGRFYDVKMVEAREYDLVGK